LRSLVPFVTKVHIWKMISYIKKIWKIIINFD
jgi:hypothetical protein